MSCDFTIVNNPGRFKRVSGLRVDALRIGSRHPHAELDERVEHPEHGVMLVHVRLCGWRFDNRNLANMDSRAGMASGYRSRNTKYESEFRSCGGRFGIGIRVAVEGTVAQGYPRCGRGDLRPFL